MSLSPLEAHYQRIAIELTQHWDDPGLDVFLDELISCSRDGRQGFPLDVMSDLLFLSELRWWLTHSDASEAAIAAERFSFGPPRS